MSANDDATISDLLRKIDREKMLINAANQMRQATNNSSVNSRIDSQVRDARRNLQYFEKTLQDLQTRKLGGDVSNLSLNPDNSGPPPPPAHGVPVSPTFQESPNDAGSYGSPQSGGHSKGGSDLMPPRAPYAPPAPTSGGPKGRPTYSRLGESIFFAVFSLSSPSFVSPSASVSLYIPLERTDCPSVCSMLTVQSQT